MSKRTTWALIAIVALSLFAASMRGAAILINYYSNFFAGVFHGMVFVAFALMAVIIAGRVWTARN